jgi:DNA-binding NarL/FixJ family response regulator
VTPARVLLVVAHPIIGSAMETLLRLEGDYDVRRVASVGEVGKLADWAPQVALVDGTLLGSVSTAVIGAPAYVLSGSERDGRLLARRLDDGRGWLRKDATGSELARAIDALLKGETQTEGGLGRLGIMTIVILSVVVLALVAYLIWLAAY